MSTGNRTDWSRKRNIRKLFLVQVTNNRSLSKSVYIKDIKKIIIIMTHFYQIDIRDEHFMCCLMVNSKISGDGQICVLLPPPPFPSCVTT